MANCAAARAGLIEGLIPRPPADVSSLRAAFSKIAATQWRRHVPAALGDAPLGLDREQAAKVYFMAEMYARACYSMLLVSARGPAQLRVPVRIATSLPINRGIAVRCGYGVLLLLEYVVPRSVHRQLALMATLMGIMDLALDEAATTGRDSVLRVTSLLTPQPRAATTATEEALAMLTRAMRKEESEWQTHYWDTVLLPSAREYCLAEALACSNAPDPTGLGHRWAGIETAIKGMWYVIGPSMGLAHERGEFQQPHWNREQQWMADTSLLMQMIDDWVDQDEDRGVRPTPVITGTWKPRTIQELYAQTITGLSALLAESGIRSKVFQGLFSDLYADYLHAAVEAMQSGLAA
jgi:hypothetical protein